MASHYKVLVNDSGPIEFCFMPSRNTSTLGHINRTLTNPQPGSQFTSFEIGYNLIVILFGLTVNGLVEFALIRNKKIRSETISPAIISLIGANFITLIGGGGWIVSPDRQLGCKFGVIGFTLMLCSVFNLQGIGILKLCKLYFFKDVEEKRFRKVYIFVAAFAWIVSLIVSFPTAIGQWGQVATECNSLTCQITNVNADGSNTGYSMSRVYFASYIIVGISNAFLNIAIYYKIQSYFKTIVSEIGNVSTDMEMNYMKKEKQIAKMMLANSVLYALFPIPLAVLYVIEEYPRLTVENLIDTAFITLWGSTAIVEPVLILAFKEKYRQEIKTILKGAYSSVKDKFSITHATVITSVTD